jgi:hypothetical protein
MAISECFPLKSATFALFFHKKSFLQVALAASSGKEKKQTVGTHQRC